MRFPDTYSAYDGESAAAFLDRLRFPEAARDLALEVFARSFFADPREFGAGELVAMFHTYFLGSAEGLLFDVPDDDYDRVLWEPLGRHLHGLGVETRVGARATAVQVGADAATVVVDGQARPADAVVLATDPRTSRGLIAGMRGDGLQAWQRNAAATVNAPPFAVVRLWFDRVVDPGPRRLHLIGPDRWAERPGVRTPSPRLVLAGDWVRCDYPVALMERAATTGFLAANALLEEWGVAGQDVWTVPLRGLLGRR